MNQFGTHFRITIFGESHGSSVNVLIDGCPAGLPLSVDNFRADLDRRKPHHIGDTPRRETDVPKILTGLLNNTTTGTPIHICFENKDVDSSQYKNTASIPRPGHADLTANVKYGGHNDMRGGGQFSGRMTTALVAAGVVAKKLLPTMSIHAQLVEAGGSKEIESAIAKAKSERDSIGGLIECSVEGLPASLGEPFFNSVESMIGHLVFSIPGITGIEFGAGFDAATMTGSAFNDTIIDTTGRTATNHCGGINGGITNGNPLTFCVAVKPTPSIGKEQSSINLGTGERESLAIIGRHDGCFARRMPVIIEAATAIVLADFMIATQRIGRIWQ